MSTDWTAERIAESRRICNAATAGPWIHDVMDEIDGGYSNGQVISPNHDYAGNEVSPRNSVTNPNCMTFGDGEFIAHARTALPDALDEIERLRKENDDLLARAEAAEKEIERLQTWDGFLLLDILDKFYPEDVFPTLPDDSARSEGPRIVSLLRKLDRALKRAEAAEAIVVKLPKCWRLDLDEKLVQDVPVIPNEIYWIITRRGVVSIRCESIVHDQEGQYIQYVGRQDGCCTSDEMYDSREAAEAARKEGQ